MFETAPNLSEPCDQRLNLLAPRIKSAVLDERALTVVRLLKEDLTPQRMGHIIDLIQEDIGGSLPNLAGKANLTRFYRSINHPDVYGQEARHIVSRQEPPPDPMLLAEAQMFVRNVSNLWFQKKAGYSSDA
jgi:hypothetical protein